MVFSIREIGRICSSLQETKTFLRQNRLLKSEYRCCEENCHEVKSRSSDGTEFKCNICGKRYSVRSNSFFFNVHMNLQNLLMLTYLFCMKIPVQLCVNLLIGEVSHVSVKQWYNFLREVMSTHLLRNPIQLGGDGCIVELDESALGRKRKYNRGYVRGSGIKWIFGMVDIQTGKCHIELVPDRSRVTLYPIIRRHIIRRTTIHSDEAAVYFTLQNEGYIHKTVEA